MNQNNFKRILEYRSFKKPIIFWPIILVILLIIISLSIVKNINKIEELRQSHDDIQSESELNLFH